VKEVSRAVPVSGQVWCRDAIARAPKRFGE
jgi:hypothetical protein